MGHGTMHTINQSHSKSCSNEIIHLLSLASLDVLHWPSSPATKEIHNKLHGVKDAIYEVYHANLSNKERKNIQIWISDLNYTTSTTISRVMIQWQDMLGHELIDCYISTELLS